MNVLYLVSVLLVAGEKVPINRNAKVVLRCEDTTTGDDERGALSACQWGCYRSCLGGRVAQSDAGVKAVDIMITGEELSDCLYKLPANCRLHGSVFQYSLLDGYCSGRFKIEVEEEEVAMHKNGSVTESAPIEPKEGRYIKLLVPKMKSDMSLYTTTFSPTSVSVGFRGEVPTDDCMKDSFYTTEVYGAGSFNMDCSESPPLKAKGLLHGENFVRPFFSTNRLDVELSAAATTMSVSQVGFAVEESMVVMRTPSSCYVDKPEEIFFFSKGNFTLTTGVMPLWSTASALLSAVFVLSI